MVAMNTLYYIDVDVEVNSQSCAQPSLPSSQDTFESNRSQASMTSLCFNHFIYLALIIPPILKITGQCEFLQRIILPQRTCSLGRQAFPQLLCSVHRHFKARLFWTNRIKERSIPLSLQQSTINSISSMDLFMATSQILLFLLHAYHTQYYYPNLFIPTERGEICM